MAEASEIRMLVDRLRAEGRALEGDGFGRIGYLKSGYKKIAKSLEEFAILLEMPVPHKEESAAWHAENPDCFGSAGDNVLGCECKKVFESFGV